MVSFVMFKGITRLRPVRYHRRMAMNLRDGSRVAPSAADESAAAALFHGLADPSRLAILLHLTAGEHRVVDLTAHLGLAQSTVSKHLACLRASGLVESRRQGRASWFTLRDQESLLDLLATAERLLAGTGDVVSLCPAHESAGVGGERR